MFYYDPYKERKFGEIRGEKGKAFFRLYLDEVSFYPTENGYVVAGWMPAFSGVARKFKPENPILPGLCALPIYAKDYTTRLKNKEGRYEDVPQKASLFEKMFAQAIEENKNSFTGEGLSFKGWIDFLPDDQAASIRFKTIDLTDPNFDIHQSDYWKLEPFPSTGKHPKWEDDKRKAEGSGKGYGNYSKPVSPEDKLAFIKKELVSCLGGDYEATESLATLVRAFKNENVNEQQTYNDILSLFKAVVS